jgi:hypothetical protein
MPFKYMGKRSAAVGIRGLPGRGGLRRNFERIAQKQNSQSIKPMQGSGCTPLLRWMDGWMVFYGTLIQMDYISAFLDYSRFKKYISRIG